MVQQPMFLQFLFQSPGTLCIYLEPGGQKNGDLFYRIVMTNDSYFMPKENLSY